MVSSRLLLVACGLLAFCARQSLPAEGRYDVIGQQEFHYPTGYVAPQALTVFRWDRAGTFWAGGVGSPHIFNFDGSGQYRGALDLRAVPGWEDRRPSPWDVAFDEQGYAYVLLSMISPGESVLSPVIGKYSRDYKFAGSIVLQDILDPRTFVAATGQYFYVVGLESFGTDTGKLVHKFDRLGRKVSAFVHFDVGAALSNDSVENLADWVSGAIVLQEPDTLLIAQPAWPTITLRRFDLDGNEISPARLVQIPLLGPNDLGPDPFDSKVLTDQRNLQCSVSGRNLIVWQSYTQKKQRPDGVVYTPSLAARAYVVGLDTGVVNLTDLPTLDSLGGKLGVLQFVDDKGDLFFRCDYPGRIVLLKCRRRS